MIGTFRAIRAIRAIHALAGVTLALAAMGPAQADSYPSNPSR